MGYTRRDFVGLASATLAAGTSGLARATEGPDDPLGFRQDFPVNIGSTYLNSPYIAPSPISVMEAGTAFLEAKTKDPVSLGSMLGENQAVREKFAALVGAEVGEIGLLSTTSEGENIVTGSIDWRRGDNVVIDTLHYNTTMVLYSELAKRHGIDVRVVPDVDGAIQLDAIEARVDDRTRLVSVSWVSHRNGFRHDLDAVAEIAHAKGAYLYADAIQGIGALDLDVRQTGVDFFTSGTYKWLLGGYGLAPFFVRNELLGAVNPDRIGWRQVESEPSPGEYRFYDDARKFGYATPSFGAVYQLSAALDYLADVGVTNIEGHALPLARMLNQALREQGFRVLTPIDNASQIVAFEHGTDAARARASLEEAAIKVSFREGDSQVRIGVALFNNAEDCDRLLATTKTWI